tara:strand:- start:826 stop:1248 length:423 start_codon:yes stop_codon:yes gene_type:complete
MIFYNNQLMKNHMQLRLYLVSNPTPFKRFEDHEAALQIQLHELVEKAIKDKEDPVALMEEYLQTNYNGGDTVEDMANYLANTPQMVHALHTLKDNWDQMDETLPEDSLMYGGTTRNEAVQAFSEITLRNYLEALTGIYNG